LCFSNSPEFWPELGEFRPSLTISNGIRDIPEAATLLIAQVLPF
jgi:hypothetical protein